MRVNRGNTFDVAIIGAGIVGLSTAHELGSRGASCVVFDAGEPGGASGAAAGLLAPSVGHLAPDARMLFMASLDAYPAFLEPLQAFDPELRLLEGLIELGADLESFARGSRALSEQELSELEPALAHRGDVRLYPRDGAIDNVRLIRALRAAAVGTGSVTFERARVDRLDADGGGLTLRSARDSVRCSAVVVAAGAWSPRIAGLPRSLPVHPLKGQMLAVESRAIQHPVMGNEVYLVPRAPDGEVVIGATAERAGFDLRTDQSALDWLLAQAAALCPALSGARVTRAWAGLRPATPDMLPVIDRDPGDGRIVYACGHSKNGILLAPLTGRGVAALALGEQPDVDLRPFSLARFAGETGAGDETNQ